MHFTSLLQSFHMFLDHIIFPSLNSSKIFHSTLCSSTLLKPKQKCVHMLTHTCACTRAHTHLQESKQKPMSPFYVSQLLLRFRLALECGWYTHITHTEEKWFPHSYQVPVTNSFLLRDGNLCWASVWFEFVHVFSILSEPPWVHTCSSNVKSGNCCCLGVFYPF